MKKKMVFLNENELNLIYYALNQELCTKECVCDKLGYYDCPECNKCFFRKFEI